ncbi:MAG: class I SAM-dependent methyltransferase [candidate division Zixibacteria bacterium]|nr:class I SAM-dependent methyltransferase [candidate division Zixibacteria bacterium]
MPGLLHRNRLKINEELRTPDQRKHFSPATYGAHQVTVPAILKYAQGKLIDIGCGDLPFKEIIEQKVEQYDTFDVERRVPEVKYVGDIQDMTEIKDNQYDSVLCLEVLEHIPDPFKACDEMNRVMKSGGMLILSIPHLSRLHEEPHDHFRYTKYGLKGMLEKSGFEIISIEPRGGIFSFLGHQISTMLVCTTFHIPVIKEIVFFLNKWFCVKLSYFLDSILDKKKIFALGYTCVAKKK